MTYYSGYGNLKCPECGSDNVKLRELDDGAWCKSCGYEDVEMEVFQKKTVRSNRKIKVPGFLKF